jgi:hypothetical protein
MLLSIFVEIVSSVFLMLITVHRNSSCICYAYYHLPTLLVVVAVAELSQRSSLLIVSIGYVSFFYDDDEYVW